MSESELISLIFVAAQCEHLIEFSMNPCNRCRFFLRFLRQCKRTFMVTISNIMIALVNFKVLKDVSSPLDLNQEGTYAFVSKLHSL